MYFMYDVQKTRVSAQLSENLKKRTKKLLCTELIYKNLYNKKLSRLS